MTDHSAFDKLLSADNNTLLSHFNPKISRTIDEYNNNNDDLNLKRSQEKFSALRALNDLYNVRNNLQSQNSIVPSKLNLPIKKTISDNIDLENSIMKNDPLIENSSKKIYESTKSQWFNNKNNSEIGKWVEKTQEFQKKSENNHIVNIENENSKSNDERALNELLTQVAELDQIYADTNTKLLSNNVDLNLHEIDIHDNMTYTSLQMAMKNPIELFDLKNNDKDDDNEKRNYDDVPINSPIIAISNNNNNNNSNNNVSSAKRDDFDERLPPLPPKRIRKTPSMPVLSVAMAPIEVDVASSSSSSFRNDGAPNKNLPSPPGTLPKQAKQGLFSKLFAKKQKKERDTMNIKQLPNVSDSLTSLKNNNDQIAMHNNIQLPRPSMTSITSVKSLKFDGDESPPYGIELTEAENYALYTDMAPHATASEFDELSFYYSPVEGGKIFTKET
ncbi:embryonic polarity protein dorsal-like [Leptopilina boulardi]|uniref:embryonic polarity protein dorsal-like n=1 Tax=Leptopilina boulardi TaxID=63433 RepID=UPI0021F69B0A|nr:embryonic polarity protein dorsal-like [Leptopilina boulardi]